MSILGNLVVQLSANTASFLDEMTRASKTARTAGREIEDSFSRLGSVASSALAPFGEFGSFLGETLDRVGSSAGSAIQSLGKLGGGVAPLAVGLGAVAGAAAAVTAGSVALATHTAESIAKMNELAQASGISVESLSALAFAGKNVGIETDSMAKIIQKMDKAVLAAATSPGKTADAFTRLHISVKDASGEIRPATDIMTDLAGKFAAMPDSVSKTALALQIFGRSGAQIIPLLNRGAEGMKEMTDTAQALGVVIDGQTAAAATKFKEDLVTLEAAGQGASIRLTKDLLPTLDFLAERLVTAFKTGSAQELIDWLARITKGTIAVADTIWAAFQQVGIAIGNLIQLIIEDATAVGKVAFDLAAWKWGDAVNDAKEGTARISGVIQNFINDTKKNWKDNADFINGVFSPQKTLPVRQPGKGAADTTPTRDTVLDAIQARLKALQEEAKGWANIGAAGTQAEQLIAEAVKKGNTEFEKLKEQAAKDKTGAALPFVQQNESAIKTAEAMIVFGEAIKKVTSELDNQALKMGEQSKIAINMASAYNTGGRAIADAFVGSKFAEQAAQLDKFVAAHNLAITTFGKESPLTKQLAQYVDDLTRSLNASTDAVKKLASDQLNEELAKQGNSLRVMRPYVDDLNASYFKSEDAIRAARVELGLYQWEQEQLGKGIVATAAQIEAKRNILRESDQESYESSLVQSAAQYSINRLYDEQITKLERVREIMQQYGQDTLLIDARLQSAQQQLIRQWDDAAAATGTFSERSKAFFNEIILEGQDAGKKIQQAFLSAYDSITGALAKLATGQKANFKQIFQGLAEQVTKAEIQKGVGSLASSLGLGKIPGISGKPDGSSDRNALWVRIAQGGKLGSAGNEPFSLGDFFGKGSKFGEPGSQAQIWGDASFGGKGTGTGLAVDKLFGGIFGGGKADGSKSSPFYVISAGGSIGSLFGGGSKSGGGTPLSGGDSFGGFFAGGGDIAPGHWGITGEKGPEVVKGPATVIPSGKLGKTHQITQNNHFNFSQPTDLFRRTPAQLNAHQARLASIAYSRS